jgi:molybdenum cofactor biosynthesis enzyme MoaA
VAESGLDSIRISMNSARPDFYAAYYRPKDYGFEDVVDSVSLSVELGLYTMVNYLVFPGISDQEEEIKALIKILKRTGVNFLHIKNLNIDPDLYIRAMPPATSRAVGMKKMTEMVREALPDIQLGYFNQPVPSRSRARYPMSVR